jgi:hypothetical protein
MLKKVCGVTANQTSKVLPNYLGDDRVLVKDVAYSLLPVGSWLLYGLDRYRHLITLLFAHFQVTPISIFLKIAIFQ